MWQGYRGTGGYEDVVDDGEEFTSDLSGNKRTAEKSSDQTLGKASSAIAKNFHAEFDAEKLGTTGRKGRRSELCEEKARERNLSTDFLQLMV